MPPDAADAKRGGSSEEIRRGVRRRFAQVFLLTVGMAAVLFLAAGRLDLPMAWAYFGGFMLCYGLSAPFLLRRSPEVVARRSRVPENAKGWDKILAPLIALVGPLATLIVAGLDLRFGASPQLPPWLPPTGLVVVFLGYALVIWSMDANPFFAGLVAVQDGHTVATRGPYRWIRHPGYVGMTLLQLPLPLVLDSLWAFVPVAATTVVVLVRTALEDGTLQRELPGYREYAAKVRYRLLPYVW